MPKMSVGEILKTIDDLPESDRRIISVEVLRRVLNEYPVEVSDEALVLAAEDLFLDLDSRESEHGKTESR